MPGSVIKMDRQKMLENGYSKLCQRFSRYEVWQDMVWLIACAISNAVDKHHWEKREAKYMDIVKKYNRQEIDVMPELFANIVQGMEETPDCDFLGELYMRLELGNKHAGQFFTPYSISRMMAKLNVDPELVERQIMERGFISINDCACGAGATLVAAANILREHGIDYHQHVLFVGQDIDYTVALMCYIQLSLLGCAGYVHIGNTLSEPMTGPVLYGDGKDTTWYTPMYFSEHWSALRAIDHAKRTIFTLEAPPTPCE